MNFFVRLLFALVCVVCSATGVTLAQSYGLGFESYDVIQDNRTSLDLTANGAICPDGDFELTFELGFLPYKKNYFGYVLRLIENDKNNIDIVYDNSTVGTNRFKVVVGDKSSGIVFGIPEPVLFSKWSQISLRFSRDEGMLSVLAGGKKYTQPLNRAPKSCFKILFGTNQYKNFITTDVPPMKVRNVAIHEGKNISYFWPLDQTEGLEVTEEKRHAHGKVLNPLWIRKMHLEWESLKHFVVNGPARATFDPDSGRLYIIGKDSLINLKVATKHFSATAYESGAHTIFPNNQAFFDRNTGQVFEIYINEQQVSRLDLNTLKWDRKVDVQALKTHFLHANKFYSPSDSALYILGGYGHLEYKRDVQKYDLKTGKWTDSNQVDSVFNPRYLAALGAVANGAYVLGGYGSPTGKQILNPRNWYDLLFFNSAKGAFKKIYELPLPKEDFVLANSMYINEKTQEFYALTFPKDKFNSELQLIRGSLLRPEYQVYGTHIPYKFVDTQSFADLYFDSFSGRFVAVTLFQNENNQSEISVYSLYSPPLAKTDAAVAQHSSVQWLWWSIALLLVSGIGIYVYRFRRPTVRSVRNEELPTVATLQKEADITPSDLLAKNDPHNHDEPLRNEILLFGNLLLFDENGNDITRLFTPLLKELFLVILLHTIRSGGISSEKLTELLWFDKSVESARNNRSVNIAKLKGILDKLKYCKVSKESGYWKIDVDYNHMSIDYARYLNLIGGNEVLPKTDIIELTKITKRGSFLSDLEYEWLDSFKSAVSNEIIDTYLRYAASVKLEDDPEFLIQLSSYIFYFDPVNEEAMTIKCKALAHLGKHSLAKSTLENFAREYNRIYGEDFRKDMPEVLHS